MADDKPPLDPDVWEDIARIKHAIKKSYVETFAPLLEDLPSPFDDLIGTSDGLPPPPKQPRFLQKKLAEYALQLFDIEAFIYPKAEELPVWIGHLADRVEKEVITHIVGMRRKGRPFGPFRSGGDLSYHASLEQMRTTVRDALKPRIQLFKSTPDTQTIGGQNPQSERQPIEQAAIVQSPECEVAQPLPPARNKKRMPSTITSLLAARRMEHFLNAKGIGQTEFASALNVTDRNLRAFRATGKIKRGTFDVIAAKMGTTREALMDPKSEIPS